MPAFTLEFVHRRVHQSARHLARPTSRPALLLAIAFVSVAQVARAQGSASDTSRVIEYRGGRWFDGSRFKIESRWVQGARFVSPPSRAADSVVRVNNLWFVPPYADAHTHSPDAEYNVDAVRDMYLRSGVFYVQVLANSSAGRRRIANRVNIPSSVDAVYADAAVTASGGHPQLLYESLGLYRGMASTLEQRIKAGRSRAREGETYLTLDSLSQLPNVVARLRRDSVPILKIMLLDTEHRRTMADDSTAVGSYGLSAEVVRPLVDSAHAMGRRVWAHVETAADVQLALDAGVDGLAHVPGYGVAAAPDSTVARYRMPAALVRRVAKSHIPVVTTIGLTRGAVPTDANARRRVRTVFEDNVRRLARSGALLLTGSDTYSDDQIIRRDAEALTEVTGGGALALLRLRSVTTPREIFPGRMIGSLAPGFEASFLALGCNPLTKRECLLDIRDRTKQGVALTVPPAAQRGR